MQRRHLLAQTLATLCSFPLSPISWAQNRPIRLIVPEAPGSPLDLIVRDLTERVQDSLGPVMVDNQTASDGHYGAYQVAKAVPDGMTIGIATTATHASNPWLYRRMPHQARTDFAAITLLLRSPRVLAINTEVAHRLKIRTVNELIAYARVNPARLSYSSGGIASPGHLAGEMFKTRAGIFVLHIPYNDGNSAQKALQAGLVDFSLDELASTAPGIRSGKLLALAVTTPATVAALPGTPPLNETLKDFVIDSWWGLVAPPAAPRAVIERLNQAFVAGLRPPAPKNRFAGLMAEPVASTPEEFGKFLSDERLKYRRLLQVAGISTN